MKPVNYDFMTQPQRRKVREAYVIFQKGLCQHCQAPLDKPPVMDKKINWGLFPGGKKFLNHPIHLHHDHKTGMTIGAVHSYCNAVLWQYHGE